MLVSSGIGQKISSTAQEPTGEGNSSSANDAIKLRTRIAAYGLLALIIGLIVYPYDETLTLWLKQSPPVWLTWLGSLTHMGKGENYLVPSVLVVVLVWLTRKMTLSKSIKDRLRFYSTQAAFLFTAVAVSGIITDIIKPLIGRTRPKLVEWYGAYHFVPFSIEATYLSMPSGHATTMGAVTCAMCIWFPKYRLILVPIGFVLASTRYFIHAHYLSDVIIGFGWGFTFTLFLGLWLKQRGATMTMKDGRLMPIGDHLTLRNTKFRNN
jgi:membrane-associated phospholipid phosphatase